MSEDLLVLSHSLIEDTIVYLEISENLRSNNLESKLIHLSSPNEFISYEGILIFDLFFTIEIAIKMS